MTQISFASAEFSRKKKTTRREKFLADRERGVPWAATDRGGDAELPRKRPSRSSAGGLGADAAGGFRAAEWYGLADQALEDAVYDSQALRDFIGLDLAREPVPDATTLLKFRHRLQRHDLTPALFDAINTHLARQGLLMRAGTTKNQKKERDPEMHQTKKGKPWHFGMKAHIAVDAESGLVHSVVGTAANVNDVTQAQALLHGHEQGVLGDAGYQGAAQRRVRRATGTELGRLIDERERLTASWRAKVGHPFHGIKNLFRHRKTRYRGLAKNTAQRFSLFGLANRVIAKRSLLPVGLAHPRGVLRADNKRQGHRPSQISTELCLCLRVGVVAETAKNERGQLAPAEIRHHCRSID